ncbi:MAG: PRD domain-containing protein [Lachnospiraceae bacterium]|nr:PRD domain-containing protein [Lachnospiraceae bacterium]
MNFFKEENRLASILHIIETTSDAQIEKLAGQLNVSTKTVKNDIKELNALFSGYATISNTKGVCKLIVFDQTVYDQIRGKIFEQNDLFNSVQTRMAYIFWQLMQAKKPYLTDDLSEQMRVGRTTTISDLNKLRKIIEKYDLKILGKANTGLKLSGDEIKLRFFILENIYEHLFLNYPLGSRVRELLDNAQSKLSLDALSFGFFYRFFVIMIHRIETGHRITYLEDKYLDLYGSDAYNIVDEFLCEVEEVKDYLIPREERIYLCISIAGMRTPVNTKEIEQRINISEDIADIIVDIIDKIKAELSVTIIANELFDDFVYHMFFMINRLKYGFHIHNPMLSEIKDNHTLPYKMAEIAKDIIETRADIHMTEDEMGFMAAYFSVFLIEQEPKQECCKIAIICGNGKIIGRLIQNQVKRLFPTEPEFTFFYNGEFHAYHAKEFNYIITTTDLNINTDVPIIYMEEVFDREYIRKKFENIKYLTDAGRNMRKGIDSLFLNLLDESRFFVLDASLSYKDNIDFMIKLLHSQGDLDDHFAERLHQREQTCSMVLQRHVAFPHTYNKIPKLTLALGVYPEVMTEAKYKDIQLVILLGIPEHMENDSVIIHLYDEILAVLQDDKVIKKIQHMNSYQELLMYLTEENRIFK